MNLLSSLHTPLHANACGAFSFRSGNPGACDLASDTEVAIQTCKLPASLTRLYVFQAETRSDAPLLLCPIPLHPTKSPALNTDFPGVM